MTATASVADNKAVRESMAEVLTAEAARISPGALFANAKAKAKAKNRSKGAKTTEQTEAQKRKKAFDKDLEKTFGCIHLVSGQPSTHTSKSKLR